MQVWTFEFPPEILTVVYDHSEAEDSNCWYDADKHHEYMQISLIPFPSTKYCLLQPCRKYIFKVKSWKTIPMIQQDSTNQHDLFDCLSL